MRRDWGMTLAVAALVALSGCAAFGGGTATPGATPTEQTGSTASGTTTSASTLAETATPTATETPMPTLTPEALSTPDDGQGLPPGVRSDGTVNETRVLVAHVEAANESNWRLDHRNGNDTRVLYHADGASSSGRPTASPGSATASG